MPTLSIIVRGKVQGVFFRQSTKETALSLQLSGEVWNNVDGTVGIVVSGNREQLDAFVKWCHQGPSRARVQSVEVSEADERSFSGFAVVR
ncbi:MAG: acylphosphatase [Chitinophagaceae bacterium]|nr:acylphosphatase [Chitinophagaceae bacterium]